MTREVVVAGGSGPSIRERAERSVWKFRALAGDGVCRARSDEILAARQAGRRAEPGGWVTCRATTKHGRKL